jgi:hypothetical protein
MSLGILLILEASSGDILRCNRRSCAVRSGGGLPELLELLALRVGDCDEGCVITGIATVADDMEGLAMLVYDVKGLERELFLERIARNAKSSGKWSPEGKQFLRPGPLHRRRLLQLYV